MYQTLANHWGYSVNVLKIIEMRQNVIIWIYSTIKFGVLDPQTCYLHSTENRTNRHDVTVGKCGNNVGIMDSVFVDYLLLISIMQLEIDFTQQYKLIILKYQTLSELY